jgi:hypothetical protein
MVDPRVRTGWAWVLENASLISRASAHHAKKRGIEREDFHQELVIRLARRSFDYDPNRSSPTTWINQQCRAVSSYFRDKKRRSSKEFVTDTLYLLPDEQAHAEVENKSSVEMIRRAAGEHDFSILLARAFSLSDSECRKHVGMSRWGASRKAMNIAATLI